MAGLCWQDTAERRRPIGAIIIQFFASKGSFRNLERIFDATHRKGLIYLVKGR
jgi:hypothetical protein